MESTLYGIFALVRFVSEISLVQFQIRHQLVRKSRTRAFHEVISIYLMVVVVNYGIRRQTSTIFATR